MNGDLRRRGMEAVRGRRFPACVEALSHYVLTADEGDLEARLALAIAYSATGDDERALIILERLLQRKPNSSNLHFQRGRVLQRQGRTDAAQIAFRRAISIRPNHERAKERLRWIQNPSLAPLLTDVSQEIDVLEEMLDELEEYDRPIGFALDELEVDDSPALDELEIYKPPSIRQWEPQPIPRRSPAPVARLFIYGIIVILLTVAAFIRLPPAGATILAIGMAIGFSGFFMAEVLWRNEHRAVGGVFGLASLGGTIAVLIGVLINERRDAPEEPDPPLASDVAPLDPLRRTELAIQRLQSAVRYDNARGLNALQSCPANDRRDEVAELLEKFLGDPEVYLRLEAVRAAKIWGTRANLPSLRKAAQDESERIRAAARDAITAIEGRP